MKKMYFLRNLLLTAALVGAGSLFAQTGKVVNLEQASAPVYVTPGATEGEKEEFPWAFRNSASWGDYNNDGNLDVLIIGYGQSMARLNQLYRNNGNGTFTKVESPFGWLDKCCAVWFDFNNDGNLDLLLSGNTDDGLGAYTVLFKNLGIAENYDFELISDTDFEYVDNGGEARTQRYVVAGDFDNDGWVDIFLQGDSGSGRTASLYLNLQGTGFQKIPFPVNGTDAMMGISGGNAAWGDWNKDGYLDLLSMGYAADHDVTGRPSPNILYTNNGNGTFATPVYLQGGEEGETAWFDLNNDGFLDIFASGQGWGPPRPDGGDTFYYLSGSIFENDGAGNFTLIEEALTGIPGANQGVSVAAGDINNDGYEDLMWQGTYHHSSVFLNNYGAGTFNRELLTFKSTSEENVGELIETDCTKGIASMVDFDNDGWLDIFTSGWMGPDGSYILQNKGDEDIEPNQAPSVPTNLKAEKEGDITTFSWDASTDDTTPEEALKYNLYVKESDVIKAVLPVNLTTGRLKVNDQLAPINTTSYKLSGLGSNYTWGVQAIDNGKATSLFATATVGGVDGVDSQVVVKQPKSVQYFDLTGKAVDSAAKGVVIKKTTYDDGSVKNSKTIK